MHSTDAFDFFDSSRDGTLQATEVFRMFKWAGITANARQLLSFILAVDSDGDDQIDQSEFMAALRLPACSPRQAAHECERRQLHRLDSTECAGIDQRIQEERENLKRERIDRNQLVQDLREQQERRVRAEMLDVTVSRKNEHEGSSEPNPSVSANSAR